MGKMRKIVQIDEELCDGCGKCATACAEGALEIKGGKAHLISDSYCDGLGACLADCPRGAVRVIEREAEEFDPEEVERRQKKASVEDEFNVACSCPSMRVETFARDSLRADPLPNELEESEAELSHWPIQIRLVPAGAQFLKGADLVIVSDCAPVAYPNFHRRFVKGKAVLLGCPKFDNAQEYVRKFAEIFRTAEVKSVTVVDMEVPCCSALLSIVKRGMREAGMDIPIEEIVISLRGVAARREAA